MAEHTPTAETELLRRAHDLLANQAIRRAGVDDVVEEWLEDYATWLSRATFAHQAEDAMVDGYHGEGEREVGPRIERTTD